jgi:autotransporter-associated beta strand protein
MVCFQQWRTWQHRISLTAVLAAVLGGSVAWSQVVDISGSAIAPDTLIPAGQSGRFIADSTTAWNANWSRPLDINGFTVMSMPGNNSRSFSSVISGTGIVASDNSQITLSGTAANTFTGTYRPGGLWVLSKTAGLDAINGTLQLTWISGAAPYNTFGQPVVRWDQSNNVNDATQIIFGSGTDAGSSGLLNFNNRSDTVGNVTLLSYGLIDMGANSTASVSFADSSAIGWTSGKFVKVLNYTATSTIGFGGLTSTQLGQIYFRNPTGFAAGTYTARFASGTSGAIVPDQPVTNPTVPISGTYSLPNAQIGDQQDATLTANATFANATTNINVNINGFTFTSDTGGGNPRTLSGLISGTSGTLSLPQRNLTIAGTAANTFAGTTVAAGSSGTLSNDGVVLAKTAGLDAIAGPLRIDSVNANQFTVVRYTNSDQVNNASVVTFNPTNATATSILRMNGKSDTIGGLVTSGTGIAVIENESGAANTGTLTVSIPTGVTRTFAGAMRNGDGVGTDGVLAFGKTGLGTQVLSGTSTYTGATTISGGTLLVNGTHTGGAAYAVSAGGTLGGTGSLTAAVNASGTVAPGQSIESLATGAISFLSGSSFAYEFDSSLVTGDLLASAGGLSILSGTTLSLLDLGSGTLPTDGSVKLTLISYAGSWNSGVFDYQGSPLANLNSFSVGGNEWQIRYDDTTGGGNFTADQSGATGFVTITAVPEPAGMLGAAAGLGLAAAFLRRFSISRDGSVGR